VGEYWAHRFYRQRTVNEAIFIAIALRSLVQEAYSRFYERYLSPPRHVAENVCLQWTILRYIATRQAKITALFVAAFQNRCVAWWGSMHDALHKMHSVPQIRNGIRG
jgi:hypothetical protein